MRKISSKIIITITVCCLIISTVIGSISVYESSKHLKQESKGKLLFMAQSYCNEFDKTLNSAESSVDTFSANVAAAFDLQKFKSNPKKYIKEYEIIMDSIIKKTVETLNGVQGYYLTINPKLTGEAREIWYVDEMGNGSFNRKDSDPDGDYITYFTEDNEYMGWYYNPIKERKGIWSEPYEEEDLNNLTIVSYTKAIEKDGILIGVVGIDVKIDDLKKSLQEMKVYDTGYAFLLNDDYDILIHPNYKQGDNLKTVNNGAFKVITEEMDRKDLGSIEYKYDSNCYCSNDLIFFSRFNSWKSY
ncbi:PDC sensor domain-containing protein [Clostridium sp. ZS2-4]|uniref:PDC sensor domain-containing protein n=1 Tax=Clostridium sp. ZS2-4 TaxID=2987703 RepID=UPI00227B886D|nr:cache domain-containing protein [Clostridium sp. ZS2-4]MCY6354262.1 cache domain-containing protein [Clostridium sp. ZS2-4]